MNVQKPIYLFIAAICLAGVSHDGFAQATQGVDLRYATLLKDPERLAATPGNTFGDQHNTESGSLSFNVVDVSIPGNSDLPVEFRRSMKIEDILLDYANPASSRLSDWDFDLPRIQAAYEYKTGWVTSDPARQRKNCSVTNPAYIAPPGSGTNPDLFPAEAYWSAPSVHFPGQGSSLLLYNQGRITAPADGGPYYWLTSNFDYVSCLASIQNVGKGTPEEVAFSSAEGYMVRRPDGTRYWFDWMAVDKTTNFITASRGTSVVNPWLKSEALRQATTALYATRVEDRFGNWVNYHYSNANTQPVRIDRIESSDGRVITFSYSEVQGVERLTSVAAHGRTWLYDYSQENLRVKPLVAVGNPDGSAWNYSGLSKPSFDWSLDQQYGSCARPDTWRSIVNFDATVAEPPGDGYRYWVVSPSGARAEFHYGLVLLGRSGVPKQCRVSGTTLPGSSYQDMLEQAIRMGGKQIALLSKTITGPGIEPLRWRYNYQSDMGHLPFTNGTSRTKILDPKGLLTTYVYGNVYKGNEGLLLSVTETLAGTAIRTVTNQYAAEGDYPKQLGRHPNIDSSDFGSAYLRPKIFTRTAQDGSYFDWSVSRACGSLCLDGLGRPTTYVEASGP